MLVTWEPYTTDRSRADLCQLPVCRGYGPCLTHWHCGLALWAHLAR